MGNPGWDYNSVEPYFKKLEDFKGKTTPRTGELSDVAGKEEGNADKR